MDKTRRRDFLKASVGTAVAMAAPWPLSARKGLAREPSAKINATVAAIRPALERALASGKPACVNVI